MRCVAEQSRPKQVTLFGVRGLPQRCLLPALLIHRRRVPGIHPAGRQNYGLGKRERSDRRLLRRRRRRGRAAERKRSASTGAAIWSADSFGGFQIKNTARICENLRLARELVQA